MIRRSRRATAAIVGGGVVAGVLTFGIAQGPVLGASSNANPNSSSNANATPKPKTLIVAQTGFTPVAPGRPGSITLRVTNPNNQSVILTNVTTSVSSIGSGTNSALPACSKAWVSIAPWSGSQSIQGNGSASVTVPMSFVSSATVNQDNCKGVAFTFSFTATGRQA